MESKHDPSSLHKKGVVHYQLFYYTTTLYCVTIEANKTSKTNNMNHVI